MSQESQSYRAKCGLRWRGALGMPTRVTPPLAEIIVDANSLTFYVMNAKKYVLSKAEVVALRSNSGFLSYTLEVECEKDGVLGPLKVLFLREESIQELAAALARFGWEMSL